MVAEHSRTDACLCQRAMYGIKKINRTGGAKKQGEVRLVSNFQKYEVKISGKYFGKSKKGGLMIMAHRLYWRH